jgi:PAS domain S-box-containing protein
VVDESQNPEWMHYYHSALLELDPKKLTGLLRKADLAIQHRLEAIATVAGGDTERRAIRDALLNLRVLELEVAGADSKPRHSHPEVSGEYVVFVDTNRRYLDVTNGVCALLGYSRAELLGKTIDDITAPELKSSVSATFQQYVNAGEMSGKYLLLAHDGRRVPIRYESRVFPDGCLVACWEPIHSAA